MMVKSVPILDVTKNLDILMSRMAVGFAADVGYFIRSFYGVAVHVLILYLGACVGKQESSVIHVRD